MKALQALQYVSNLVIVYSELRVSEVKRLCLPDLWTLVLRRSTVLLCFACLNRHANISIIVMSTTNMSATVTPRIISGTAKGWCRLPLLSSSPHNSGDKVTLHGDGWWRVAEGKSVEDDVATLDEEITLESE